MGIFRGKSIIRDNAAWRAVAEIIWAFLCFLALLAQIYVLGFAALTHPLILAFALAGYFAARFYLRKKSPATAEEPLGVPLAYVVVFVVLHLFLEMVPGHLATPAVHAVAKYFGALSRSQPFIYYAVMALVPFVFLFAGGPRMRRCIRINTKAAAALAVLFVLMLVARFSFIGLVAALGVAVVFLSDLHRQPLRASVDPRSLVDRVMPFAIPALAIVFGHYASFTWNCARARDLPRRHPAHQRTCGCF
ncbi:MAG: hypothetical protein M5R36_09200 [Deltaproteobacteria bacterium]|nr:hypothetical protein [Deltaproteobacteria bacterium]